MHLAQRSRRIDGFGPRAQLAQRGVASPAQRAAQLRAGSALRAADAVSAGPASRLQAATESSKVSVTCVRARASGRIRGGWTPAWILQYCS